jgi:hypothetical protein
MLTKNTKKTAALGAKKTPSAPVQATKLEQIVKLLHRSKGADLSELMSATGWQAHSVRGALSGSVRGKLKLLLTSEKIDGRRVYKVAKVEA